MRRCEAIARPAVTNPAAVARRDGSLNQIDTSPVISIAASAIRITCLIQNRARPAFSPKIRRDIPFSARLTSQSSVTKTNVNSSFLAFDPLIPIRGTPNSWTILSFPTN